VGAALLLLEGDHEESTPPVGFNVDPAGGSWQLNYHGNF
jgi:hypothetical protein